MTAEAAPGLGQSQFSVPINNRSKPLPEDAIGDEPEIQAYQP